MSARSTLFRNLFLGVSAIAGAAALAAGFTGLPAGRAEAQNIMAAPACQCSAATAIPELSSKVVHCLCGGMGCVISEHRTGAQLMQCVR